MRYSHVAASIVENCDFNPLLLAGLATRQVPSSLNRLQGTDNLVCPSLLQFAPQTHDEHIIVWELTGAAANF